MDDDDLFEFSRIEIPTVVGLLKNVLTQYPDNGQILKELVQNAEDAGATTFEVVHDTRNRRSDNKSVKRFIEGPALFVYNNAVFNDADWGGIKMLSDSIKRDDLLKVGQFGLGFKSVFHFTDFVTIISGNNVLFMDPNEPEARMCRTIPLSRISTVIPENECLDLWGIYLQKEHLRDGHVPGTIFWFPLRREESKLSSTVYGQRNVERLFQSFSVEAPLCLTFLKSLENISIRKVEESAKSDILKVSLSGTTLLETQQRRRAFKNQLEICKGFPAEALTCKYDITVDACNQQGIVSQQNFKILHYLPCTPEDERSAHMPLVGVAAPIPPIRRDAKGQIFCFLPLPLESANNTNLPVQVNGYFALDQNRRHVKWKTEESNSEPDVIWNESLVKDVLSDAYFYLLQDILDDVRAGLASINTFYSLLPNVATPDSVNLTSGRWEELSRKIWTKLLQERHPIIYSSVKEEMMYPGDVISTANLDRLPKLIAVSVRTVLEDVGLPLAIIPENVEATLCNMGTAPKSVTPKLLRDCLKNNTIKSSWNRLYLLQYVLSDSKYEDLSGIELIPLKSGGWSTFSSYGEPVYVCTEKDAAAFIGAEERLLSTDLCSEVSIHLHNLAEAGTTILSSFSASDHTSELLRVSVSHVQKDSFSKQQLKEWLENVWSLLNLIDLQEIENLLIIPRSEDLIAPDFMSLSSAIVVKDLECQVPETCIEALGHLEINVLSMLPSYVRHPDLPRYIFRLDAQGVNQALEKLIFRHHDTSDIVNAFNERVTDEQRMAFCNKVCELECVKPQVKNFLKTLCIFKAVQRDKVTSVCVENLGKMYPIVDDFPVSSPEPLLMPYNSTVRSLALKLDATQLSIEEMCILVLQNTYSEGDAEKLGWYILNYHNLWKSDNILRYLKNVKFITSSCGQLCMASELYDPLDSHVDALLGEDLTPDKKYREYNSVLKCLGLKAVLDMPKEGTIKIVKEVSMKQLSESDRAVKIKSLLKAINGRIDCKHICQEFRNVKCIYGVSSRPSKYPSNLMWATKNVLYRPCQVSSLHFKDVVGSLVPLVDCDGIPNVASSFGWNQEPSVDNIIEHLKNVIQVSPALSDVPGSSYYEHLKRIYHKLNSYVGSQEESTLFPLSTLAFVLTGNGFKLPSEVYMPSGKEDLQLLPYMHPLPFELCESKKLFCYLGAFQTQSLQLFLELLKQIENQHASNSFVDCEHDMRVVNSVLQKLVQFRYEIDCEQLLLPVETSRKGLELVEVTRCAYSYQDCDWLDGEELGVRVVHRSVGNRLAKDLGVESLNKHLLADEEAVMEWEQHEPLTTRIHNLLYQYRDGVAVLKELVQNADDAGATKLFLLYDERHNLDSRKRLITEQLTECQGPALWAYNDALFTDKDFENLCKLGGGTKELMSTKIGKFGLGFCSVYNLTDVPSFVSGNNYIIFDPHQTYLEGKKGGVRYDFSKKMNKLMLRKLDGQFQPYSNIFGCKIQETSNFDGTLFRFPLRTTEQASKSKICDQSYSHNEMIELLTMFRKIIGEVLLFTQNIKEVKVLHLGKDSDPKEIELLYGSCKERNELLSVQQDCPNQTIARKQPVEKVAQLFGCDHKWNQQVFQENTICDIKVSCSRKGAQMLHVENGTWSVTWLTSWHSGTEESCRLAEKLGGKVLSLASVSVPVERRKDTWKPKKLEDVPEGFYKESHMHCFLPLPLKTSLPVQVNGYFEVASDRTNLSTRTEDDRSTFKDWNTVLMRDAVNAAYLSLISTLRKEGLCQEVHYFSLWPMVKEINDVLIEQLAETFYETVKKEDLNIFRNKNGWYPLSKCYFLSDTLYSVQEIGPIAFEFMGELLKKSNRQIMELPQKIVTYFGEDTSQSVVGENSFYSEYFLPNLSQKYVEQEKQNKLVLHAIDTQKPFLDTLADIYCIPTLPHGKLRKPSELVCPDSEITNLFSISDERFPETSFLEGHRKWSLLRLGMKSEKLDNEMIVERTKSVNGVLCLRCAEIRSSRILQYLKQNRTQAKEIAVEVRNINFIPVMSKPEGWSMKWMGDQCQLKTSTPCSDHRKDLTECLSFATPSCVCSPELTNIAGSSHYIHKCVNKSKYNNTPKQVCEMLGIITNPNHLPFESVVSQFAEYRLHCKSIQSSELLKSACLEIYTYFDYQARVNKLDISNLRNENILLTKYGFVEPVCFAIDVDVDCAPALFSVQKEGLGHYEHMMKSLGIRQQFPQRTVYEMLIKKKNYFQTDLLSEEEILLMSKLLYLLFHVREEDGSEDISLAHLCLPDSKGVLCPIGDLCVDDGNQMEVSRFNFLHEKISLSKEMLRWLGIEEKTRKRFLDSSRRMKFGQKEPLTIRLKGILDNYPCDSGIMKELLQNADDAGATEIAYIKDFRNHPTEKLFDKGWAPLQGPALCVYNNRGFKERDLEGIQNLGDSSKIHDPASTGQYGIGFNAVYHLTDAPSFITRGREIPGKEVLCMFDPHCMYDPDATKESPGTQLTDLDHQRRVYPDSFKGYWENLLKEEGTVFRLPLRTCEDSKIGKVMRKFELVELLDEFKSDMKICLLFLRNVRKITIYTVETDGRLSVEYSVKSHIPDEGKLVQLQKFVKDRKSRSNYYNLPFFLDMQRVSYEVQVKDSDNREYRWLLAHQFGSENSGSLPELVLQAFKEKCLKLLPQAGVALLLASSEPVNDEFFKNFCYLPLPAQSGFPLCLNGHFALDNSRRDLWNGSVDFKATWNEWLMEQVMAPVIAEAVNSYRTMIFPPDKELSLEEYNRKVKVYYKVLPDSISAKSDKWKKLVTWFYQSVKSHELPLFDVYVPDNDRIIEDSRGIYGYLPSILRRPRSQANSESITGKLKWHALMESGTEFPMYFDNQCEGHILPFLSTLKRLGMKIGSNDVYFKLKGAGIEIALLSPESVVNFLLSWNSDCVDRCQPALMSKISSTPFLTVENVCTVFKYISKDKNFNGKLNHMPLLVSSDKMLKHFDEQNPVYFTEYGELLPELNHEFVDLQLFEIIKELNLPVETMKTLKYFTLDDFASKLSLVLDEKYNSLEGRIPLGRCEDSHGELWIRNVWKYIVDEVKRKYKIEKKDRTVDCDWKKGKQYLLDSLGKWSLYPVTHLGANYIVPVKDASQVLHVKYDDHQIYQELPVPHPFHNVIIPGSLQLAATLRDPVAVLEVLYHWREGLATMTFGNTRFNFNIVLEYFGKHCQESKLSVNKLKVLKIYKDAAGFVCALDTDFIVISSSAAELYGIHKLGSVTNTVILKPVSESVNALYKYLHLNCTMCDLDIFTEFILPNLPLLPESEHTELLEFLRNQLEQIRYKEKDSWTQKQRGVVSALKKTPFIMFEGQLVTASQFYDPCHPVFVVMKKDELPDKWTKYEWRNFILLAGIVHELTGEMFVEFAKTLSIRDGQVQKKSKVLVDHLCDNFEQLKSKVREIRDIEFLVPDKRSKLEDILPCFKTDSGLVSFSSSVPSRHANLIWTTISILPFYATTKLNREQLQDLSTISEVPEEKFFLHVCNVTSFVHGNVHHIQDIMDSVYGHLEKVKSESFLARFGKENVPIVHLVEKGKFVTVDVVVQNLQVEIEPYLYKVSVRYGRYFSLLEKLGMCREANCDHYVQVLNKIHENCQENTPHPEEAKCMKLALKNLAANMIDLQNITASVLYLPTKDDRLVKSTEMYVSDNSEFERIIVKNLNKPLFVGFAVLKIEKNDADFVKNLPEHLRPKFLSEVVEEQFNQGETEEIESPEVEKITSFISSQPFQKGILRLLNHIKLQSGSCLDKTQTKEIQKKLDCVEVKGLKEIHITLKVNGKEVGTRMRRYFVRQEVLNGDSRTKVVLYISRSTSKELIHEGLAKMYAALFNIDAASRVFNIMGIVQCLDNPHNIFQYLDENDIRDFGEQEKIIELYQTEIGIYLQKEFIPLLDNEFCRFHKGEIVAMKKYLSGEVDSEEDSLYVIVEVKDQVKTTIELMYDEYEVFTGDTRNPIIVVKSHQLYKFMRKNFNNPHNSYSGNKSDDGGYDLVPSHFSCEEEEEELSEQDIVKNIREQVRNIWVVEDIHERRHLLRRLYLKWHPDKNMDKKDLCTRVMQYIQSLVRRLEDGETIPDDDDDDDDHTSSSREPQSDFYRDAFRPPPTYQESKRNNWGSFRNNFDFNSTRNERSKMADRPEADKWMKQAKHDHSEANNRSGGSACWIVYMCHQAAEKALKAALFLEDCERSVQLRIHNLSAILCHLTSADLGELVAGIENRVGPINNMRYPTHLGTPCDKYTSSDADFMLRKTKLLLQNLSQRF